MGHGVDLVCGGRGMRMALLGGLLLGAGCGQTASALVRENDAAAVEWREDSGRSPEPSSAAIDAEARSPDAGAGDANTTMSECSRACLLKFMQDYLDALVAHDPARLPLSPQLRMTDNGVPTKPGQGLWKSVSSVRTGARLDFADPITHDVGTQCVVEDQGAAVIYQVRLKVDAAQITEIEAVTVRADDAWFFFEPDHLVPQPVFEQPPSPRMSRDDMLALTQLYLDYLEGKKSGAELPFDPHCARYENGTVTASGLVDFQLQSWGFQVTRRVLIVDEFAGIAWGMFPFWQGDSALVVGEAFKLMGGKIMMIQAVMAYMPATAWN